MGIAISHRESGAISIVRVFATFAIVLCHIFQAYGNSLAFRFNVGVQIFFVLSGYLYGHKDINKWGLWYWNRFKKLYVPCFIYCLIVLTLLHYRAGTDVTIYNYFTISAVDGIDHLWFMKAILLCYLITPVLSFIRRWPLLFSILLLGAGIVEFGCLRIHYEEFSWIWLYSLGYLFPNLKKTSKYVFAGIFLLSAIAVSVTRVFVQQRIISDVWHYCWGLSLCLLGVLSLKHLTYQGCSAKVISKIDQYSFYIYITHHIYLIGPLAIVPYMPNATVCVMCIVLLTAISSYLLKFMSDQIIKRL